MNTHLRVTRNKERGYDYCFENDGEHGPLVGTYDPEMGEGWAAVECVKCGISTGLKIPEASELIWD